MNYRVAIPSYKRHIELGGKTLNVLDRYNIPKDIIDIFVNTPEEYELYKNQYPEYNIILGKLGLKEIREFIFNYYNEGDKILCMDDDIRHIKIKNTGKMYKNPGRVLEDCRDFKEYIEKGFDLCEEHNTKIWGVSPTCNHGFMKWTDTADFRFLPGWCFGVIIDKECLKLSVAQYDDYERCILFYKKYGKLVRMNYICCSTQTQKCVGGMNDSNRINIMNRDLDIMLNKYNEYLIIKEKKTALNGLNPLLKIRK